MRGTRIRTRRESPQNLPGNFESTEAMQAFNRKRKYSIGFTFPTSATALNEFNNVSFPGTARMLLGFKLFDNTGDPTNVITINLNNENIVTSDSWANYTTVNQLRTVAGQVTGSSFNGEFYVYPRGLSGNDGIKITYKANTAGILLATFYFKTEDDFMKF